MAKPNYSNWDKKDLIKEVEALKKKKTYGLVWEEDKTKELFDYYINWDGEGTKETFGEEEGKFPVLKEVKNKSIDNKDPKYNFMIEGDNYHSLAVLNFTHNKAIDVIYIDPPYNTGKGFIYNDKIVDNEDGFRHSKWLSFMSKRLRLAKDLLTKEGVIFISINDIELAQLKILCDDIFDEKNFIANLVWENREGGGSSDSKHFKIKHEYVLVYAKNKEKLSIKAVDIEDQDRYSLKDKYEKDRGRYQLIKLDSASLGYVKSLDFPIKAPDGTFVNPNKDNKKVSRWRWGKDKLEWGIKNDFVVIKKDRNEEWAVYTKQYLNCDHNGNIQKRKLQPIGVISKYSTTQSNRQIKNLFGKSIFNYSKPSLLIKYLIERHPNKNAVILDFFAGSGTTGHAVMDLNREDSGKRKFILCTNNENNNGTELRIASDVCYPRIKKVIEGYTDNKDKKVEGYKDNFKYFKTDFVDSAPTDQNKKKIVDKSTEMLCIKENAFKPIIDIKGYKVFKNSDIHLGIIFDDEQIDNFVKEAKNIKGKFHVYVFSFDDSVPKEGFKSMKGRIKLCPIPEVILHVYRKILK